MDIAGHNLINEESDLPANFGAGDPIAADGGLAELAQNGRRTWTAKAIVLRFLSAEIDEIDDQMEGQNDRQCRSCCQPHHLQQHSSRH